MAIWTAGLGTRLSSERASKWGGVAFLIQAARQTVGNVSTVSVADKDPASAVFWFIGASFIPILLAVAGFRLWRCQGLFLGILTAVVMALDVVLFSRGPNSIYDIIEIAIRVSLLGLMINGVRGLLALRTVDYTKDVRDTFG